VVEAIRGCDLVLLVTEPTPFGLHDLELALETVRSVDIQCKVVVNRSGSNGSAADAFCRRHNVEIVAEIPDSRQVAESYSRGELSSKTDMQIRERFRTLLTEIECSA
jgi:MinD superfamily P-loop ATPase